MKDLIQRLKEWWFVGSVDLVAETPDPAQDTENVFLDELTCLLNRHSMENDSGTPDFILAQYLKSCLEAFDKAVMVRENWHGRTYEKADEPTDNQSSEDNVCHEGRGIPPLLGS